MRNRHMSCRLSILIVVSSSVAALGQGVWDWPVYVRVGGITAYVQKSEHVPEITSMSLADSLNHDASQFLHLQEPIKIFRESGVAKETSLRAWLSMKFNTSLHNVPSKANASQKAVLRPYTLTHMFKAEHTKACAGYPGDATGFRFFQGTHDVKHLAFHMRAVIGQGFVLKLVLGVDGTEKVLSEYRGNQASGLYTITVPPLAGKSHYFEMRLENESTEVCEQERALLDERVRKAEKN